MKKIVQLVKEVAVLFLIIFMLASLCYGAAHFMRLGYDAAVAFYNEHKSTPTMPKAKYDADRYFVITEDASPSRAFILDLETQKAIDIEDESDTDYLTGIDGIPTKDYDRIYAGNVTEDEIKNFKRLIKITAEDAEYCHITVDENGNTIDHYHIKNEEVVTPSEKCEDCMTLIKYGHKSKEPPA